MAQAQTASCLRRLSWLSEVSELDFQPLHFTGVGRAQPSMREKSTSSPGLVLLLRNGKKTPRPASAQCDPGWWQPPSHGWGCEVSLAAGTRTSQVEMVVGGGARNIIQSFAVCMSRARDIKFRQLKLYKSNRVSRSRKFRPMNCWQFLSFSRKALPLHWSPNASGRDIYMQDQLLRSKIKTPRDMLLSFPTNARLNIPRRNRHPHHPIYSQPQLQLHACVVSAPCD